MRSPFSRRRFLELLGQATLGGALSGCGRGAARGGGVDPVPAHITGGIVGASRELGHRLRTGDLPEPSTVRDVPVVIAGAGIAGLSAGWQLMRRGFRDFEILELESTPGGNSRSSANAVSAYPWGAHYLPVPTEESTLVRELLDEMGLILDTLDDGTPVYDERHLCHDPDTRLFLYGRWQEGIFPGLGMGPEDVAHATAFDAEVERLRGWRDGAGRKAFSLPVAESSQDPELLALDRLSMGDYLAQRGWTSERLRWAVEYGCRDDYGSTLEQTSAWAGLHYFASRPCVDAELFTWPEGNGRLVDHLCGRIGDRIRTSHLVFGVRPLGPSEQGGVEVDVFDTVAEVSHRLRARRMIYALPRFTAPYVLEGYALEGLRTFTYSPWVVANLTVDHLPTDRWVTEGTSADPRWGLDSTWDNVAHGSPSLGYVVATHQNLRGGRGGLEPSVLTWYLPMVDADPTEARRTMEQRSWDAWVLDILADLEPMHPDIRQRVQHVDVMLWGHAMIRPTPGFLWGEARRRAAEPYGAVHFAHSDMSGLSLFEEAQWQGVRAAEHVLALSS